eukprot:Nk52_evm61s224 gene=Nk52_evmTU61s224
MGGCSCREKEPIDFDAPVNLDHFKILRSIGRGAFGKVCIVMRRDNERMFAMKYMNKEKCISQKAVKNVLNEIKILKNIEHSFIVNLQYAFHDPEDIFMVSDLMMGGDLRFHLNRQGNFTEERVRLYVAEIVEALLYIHPLGIVHRDLKPDNMLLDEVGHVHLTDWNVASRLVPKKRLMGRAGTTPYMAPEVFSGKGYDYMCDWWSLGICMYEMLKGKLPFKAGSQEEIVRMILSAGLTLPTHVSSECRKLMKGFIDRNVSTRLGYVQGMVHQEVRRHPFFFKIDWAALAKKQITPPFVPAKDRVNCDAMYELEEMMLEDNPLHKKKQRLQNKADGTNEELSQALESIDKDFVVFEREKEKLLKEGNIGAGQKRGSTRRMSLSKMISRRRSSTSAAREAAAAAEKEKNDKNRRHSIGDNIDKKDDEGMGSSSGCNKEGAVASSSPIAKELPGIAEKSASAEMTGVVKNSNSSSINVPPSVNTEENDGGVLQKSESERIQESEGKLKNRMLSNLELSLEAGSTVVSSCDSQTLSMGSSASVKDSSAAGSKEAIDTKDVNVSAR